MRNTLSVRATSRTFKAVLGAGLAGALLVSALPSASAATGSVGGVCTKVGDKAKVGKISVECKSVSGKKIWTDTKVYTVSISANAILGGKNNQTASWIQNYVIPQFELSNADKGKQVEVSFTPAGIDDNQFKTQLALDLASKRGPDVMALDGFWVAEFAEAGYIKPLESIVGAKAVNAWDGWAQIPNSVQGVMSYGGKKYGVPQGTDGRIIYFNKKLFADAGLPANWQPTSWADLLTAAKTIKTKTPSVTPLLSNADKGKQVEVSFTPAGIDDNQFKTQLALDLASKRGPDVMALDGFWVAEFAEAGYIKPLESIVGAKAVNAWDGWAQIPNSVQGVMSYGGKKYGVPQGTDGRIIYFNKKLFADAGLPANWQPTSWADLLTAAKTIKTKTPSVTPLQLNAGDGMGEATAMQGFLNLLGGAGSLIYDTKTKKWTGNTKAVRDMLGFYDSVYNKDKVGNSDWQLLAGENGRNESFKAFSEGKLAMIIEGDYLWRGVINPLSGNFKMADRNTNVGFAKIPAQTPKSGVNGQSFMSMSGGSGYALNPNSRDKDVAWDLLKFINSKEPVSTFMAIGGAVRISQRQDVNSAVLKSDPCLKFVFENAIPNTYFRPASVNYNAVSVLLQKATTSIVQGKSVAETAAAYESALKDLVGAANVASN